MPKTFKAVLVPETPEMSINGMPLSSPFRKLLAELAVQHINELTEQRNQIAKRYDLALPPPSRPGTSHSQRHYGHAYSRPISPDVFSMGSPGYDSMQHSMPHGFDTHQDNSLHAPKPAHRAKPELPGALADTLDIEDADMQEPETTLQAGPVPPKKRASAFRDAQEDEVEEEQPVVAKKTERPKNLYDRIGHSLESDVFEIVLGVLIMLNIVVMAFDVQYKGIDIGNELSMVGYPRSAALEWPGAGPILENLDLAFTIIFAADVSVRILFTNIRFFQNPLNLMDLAIVVVSVVALFLPTMPNSSFVRMLRLVKLARGMRAIKNSPAVQSLQLLLKCLAASLSTLGWSLCVILILQCIMAMTLASQLADFMNDADVDIGTRKAIFRYYGTFTKTMMTMFEILYANWIPACRILIDNMGEGWAFFFVLYRCLVGWAVLSVVNAVFVQSTMKVAQHDQELLIAQKQRSQEAQKKNLRNLFKEIDTSGDGNLSFEELMAVLRDPMMKLWMSALEIETKDLKQLFYLLDDGDGEISTDEFLAGIGRVKGPAKSIDMATVMKNIERIEEKIEKLAGR
eukprot:TRINITY_DN24056_c0_g1_i1.p1 TRINITY_DN24056_c0_g1~~TRINITY_DN24056_c0_g1_i1.p1  ORF type:complete len:601 (-),score=117.80 TRINITY_DN24056_c0_g1_i1:75-1787(-)